MNLRWRVGSAMVMITLLVLVAAPAQGQIDPRTIPAGERIARANRMLDAKTGPNAAEHYRAAELVPIFDMVAFDAPEIQRRPFDRLGDNLWQLAVREDWPDELQMAANEWLARNKDALAALAKATECERYFEPVTSETGRLSDISILAPRGLGLDAVRLAAIKAVSESRAGNWDEALAWNRRLLRIATHQRWSGYPLSALLGGRSEQTASRQLLSFVRRMPAADPAGLRRRLAAERKLHPDQRILDDISLVSDWDLIESLYDWADDPEKHPKPEELLKFTIGDAREGLDELLGDPPQYRSLEEFRKALRGSSRDKAWRAFEELRQVMREWEQRPFDAAWRDREQYRERYCAVAQRDPALQVIVSCNGMVALDGTQAARQTYELERVATDAALAILQYRQTNRKLPERLEDLVPTLLKETPIDIFSGKPLVYRLSADKKDFTLYSVGRNQQDDDGKVDDNDLMKGDIVYWPPARPDWAP